MKSTAIAFVICLCATALRVSAQAPSVDVCQRLANAVQDSEKEIAWSQAAGEFETSAIRQTDADQRVANELQSISINLSLASQSHCPPRREPVSKFAYLTAAKACLKAAVARGVQAGGAVERDDLPPECVREKWQRGEK